MHQIVILHTSNEILNHNIFLYLLVVGKIEELNKNKYLRKSCGRVESHIHTYTHTHHIVYVPQNQTANEWQNK